MPDPPVHIVGGADGFGDFGEGAFDEGAEAVRGVFAEDEDVLRAVEVVGGYLRVVRQELLAVEEGFEGARLSAGCSSGASCRRRGLRGGGGSVPSVPAGRCR